MKVRGVGISVTIFVEFEIESGDNGLPTKSFIRNAAMESTQLKLIGQASDGCQDAWSRLISLYEPLVYGWLRRHDVTHHDAEELTQDVLSVVVRELPKFSHSGNPGAFRCWLRQITANRARGFWRAGKLRPKATGETLFVEILQQLEDDHSEISRRWDRDHDQYLLRQALEKVKTQFEPGTILAFERFLFAGIPAPQVANELGLSVGAVYTAKSRVLRKLRKEVEGLVDDSFFD